MKNKLFLSLAFSLLIFSMACNVFAVKLAKNDSVELQALADNLKCKTDFIAGIIDYTNSSIEGGVSFSGYSIKLQQDMDQLKIDANNEGRESFRKHLTENYSSDFKDANEAIREWRKIEYKNLNSEQKDGLKSNYNQLKSAYDYCHLSSLRNLGYGRINSFNSILFGYQNRINALAEKGVDVSSLNTIVQQAKVQIVDSLVRDVSSATSINSIKQAVRSYCLFDGCENGINFHLSAKYELAKLDIAVMRIKSYSNYSAYSEDIAELEQTITEARTELNVVDTKDYSDEEKGSIWGKIRAARLKSKEIARRLNKNE